MARRSRFGVGWASALVTTVVGAALAVSGCAPAGGGGGAGNDNTGNVNDNVTDNTNDNGAANDNENANDNTGGDVAGRPLSIFNTDSFTGSGNCAMCHSGLEDAVGADVSIDTAWRATMLANAARDPFFLASVSAEVAEAPAALGPVIEETCATCHMPMARTQAAADGTPIGVLNGGFLDPAHALHDAAMDGVSCAVCHQIQDDFLDDPQASYNGGYRIDTSTQSPDRLVYGPYPQPQQPDVMQTAVGYLPVHGPHLGQSGLCGTCHTLFTPTLNAAGEIVGKFPEQTPFLEWRQSRFADGGEDDRTCQSCHMPAAEGAVVISAVPLDLAGRAPFSQHLFLGGNVFMLRLLRDNIVALGLTASTADFNAAIALTESFLRNNTAVLTIDEAGVAGVTLALELTVTNLCGHKFPTSFPSHRAWIHLTVADGAGEIVFESGAPGADGSIAGADADEDPAAVEPHFDRITSVGQVQIYESLMADTDGAVTYTLLRGSTYAKDNRLLPEGFAKGSAGADIAVYGAAANDADFVGGSDRISYDVDVSGHEGPFAVTAELLYQTVSFRFAEALVQVDTPLAEQFGELYQDADKSPALISSVARIVP